MTSLKRTASNKIEISFLKFCIGMSLLIIMGGVGYKALGYEYAEGYAAGWKFGETNQQDIFFNEMDDAVSLGTHQQMTIWNGAGNKKMKYMFYKISDSY